jgi:hypothetical protein
MKRTLKAQGKIMSPQTKELAPGRPVMRFALVEQTPEGTTWHNCAAWGAMAHKMCHLQQGDTVQVQAKAVTMTHVGAMRRTTTQYIIETFKELVHAEKTV